MLKFAKQYEDKILKLSQELCTEDIFKWIHIGYISQSKLEDNDWDKITRVSYLNDKILGYISAQTDRASGIITNLTLWGNVTKTISEDKEFAKDILTFIEYLLECFPTIQFNVVIGNPIQRRYRKFINYIGGNIVGIHHCSALIRGKLCDEELYEIISSPEVIERVRVLKEKL